jgi:hypothetical protein
VSDLLYLIRFGQRPLRLKIQDFGNFRFGEYMVTASYALVETEGSQQRPELVESNVCVCSALKDLQQNSVAHGQLSLGTCRDGIH